MSVGHLEKLGCALEALERPFLEALARGPVVLAAPTGTGKSTLVPRWPSGRVLVVEPRRLAARALAQRVAKLDGTELGKRIGYRVRDDECCGPQTEILFVTPGIVLRDVRMCDGFDVVILDEFHERRLDLDFLLASLFAQGSRLVVMSATIDGARIAEHLSGTFLEATARTFPVAVEHLGPTTRFPEWRGFEALFGEALRRAEKLEGDVLVFLPGKGEIRRLAQSAAGSSFEVLELHGGLSLSEQSRAFAPTRRRKLILSTNVAETSLTLPGVRVVIDSGLVRRTHYHGGRSHLSIAAIAADSMTQRAGRAGRVAAGTCLRLWGQGVQLQAVTPPEIHREELSELLLWASANGQRLERLAFLDVPKEHAVAAARQDLEALGALSPQGQLTERGRSLHRLPIDPWFGRLLVEAQHHERLPEMIVLVALLAQPNLMLPQLESDADELPCDVSALSAWFFAKAAGGSPVSVRKEVRRTVQRLCSVLGVAQGECSALSELPREALLRLVLQADGRSGHVARVRKRHIAWSCGGTELQLAKESWAHRATPSQGLIVLQSRAIGSGREHRLLATCASAVPLRWFADAGLGQQRVSGVTFKQQRLLAKMERVLAGKVISSWEEPAEGEWAQRATAQLYLEGRLWPKALQEARKRYLRWQLLMGLRQVPSLRHLVDGVEQDAFELEAWVEVRVAELGIEGGEDLELLSPEDLLPPDIPAELAPTIEREFPLEVDMGDCRYRAEYDFGKKQVLLTIAKGSRQKPPPRSFLPGFHGLKLCVEAGGVIHTLRR